MNGFQKEEGERITQNDMEVGNHFMNHEGWTFLEGTVDGHNRMVLVVKK